MYTKKNMMALTFHENDSSAYVRTDFDSHFSLGDLKFCRSNIPKPKQRTLVFLKPGILSIHSQNLKPSFYLCGFFLKGRATYVVGRFIILEEPLPA